MAECKVIPIFTAPPAKKRGHLQPKSLKDVCTLSLRRHLDLLDSIGDTPIHLVLPAILHATPQQLRHIEQWNQDLKQHTQHIWKRLCKRLFANFQYTGASSTSTSPTSSHPNTTAALPDNEDAGVHCWREHFCHMEVMKEDKIKQVGARLRAAYNNQWQSRMAKMPKVTQVDTAAELKRQSV
jgi:hypothetical protein